MRRDQEGRKVRRVRYRLDLKGIKELSFEDIKAILRGADPLISRGGRGLLAKLLKGSKDKRVIELNLDGNPVYGHFKDLTIEQITARIDWCIVESYLAIEYDYRLPLLMYTSRGWEIEMDTYTDELLRGFDKMTKAGTEDFDMSHLKDRNREMIMLLLDKVEATGNPKYIPVLEAWKHVDYRKVRARISQAIEVLRREVPETGR